MVQFYLVPGVTNRKFYLAPRMRNGKIYLAPNEFGKIVFDSQRVNYSAHF